MIGAPDLLLHLGCPARMIQMAVGDPDLVQRQAPPRDLGHDWHRPTPPGSITAAFIVRVHQTVVQFCCRGVTGVTKTPIGEGVGSSAAHSVITIRATPSPCASRLGRNAPRVDLWGPSRHKGGLRGAAPARGGPFCFPIPARVDRHDAAPERQIRPMQVVQNSTEGLSRVITVTVPAAELNAKLDAKLAEMAPQDEAQGLPPRQGAGRRTSRRPSAAT